MILDQLFTQPIFEAADPSKLIVSVRIEPMSTGGEPIDKEVDLTGQFQGSMGSQMNQALDYMKKMLESKGLYFTTLQVSYQGRILNMQNRGAMSPQSDEEREMDAMADQIRAKRSKQNALPALKEDAASPEQLAYNRLRAQWDSYQTMTSGGGNTAVSRDPAHAAKLATVPAELARMAAALKSKGIDAEAQYDALSGPKAAPVDANQAYGGMSEAGNANSGRRGPNSAPDNTPVKHGRVEKTKSGIRHHADPSRYGGSEPDVDDDQLLGYNSRYRLHKAVTPDEVDEQGLRKFSHKKNRFRSLHKLQNPLGEENDPTREKAQVMIYKYFGQIYDYGDDNGLYYLDLQGDLWNQLMDKYDGEIEDIVAREPTEVLMQAAQELKGIAGDMKYELDEAGMAEGVAETVSMDQAKKVLRHYGADHFKTTTNELHFYKNGRPMNVDLIFNDDATRSVNLSQLNSATRRLKGQGVAKGQQIDEVFADQGSGSTDRDNADYMKRRNAAKKAGYTGRETKAGTWRVFKDGNAVAAAGPFKSADEAAAWIKKHKQGITEMDKSEPSAGRDTGPRSGPDKEVKPITAKKATKDATDMLNRAFQDSHKKKDVKEELTMKHQRDTYRPAADRYPDTSNSLTAPGQSKGFMGGRDLAQAEVPNITRTADGHPILKHSFGDRTDSLRIDPSLNSLPPVTRADGRTFPAGTPAPDLRSRVANTMNKNYRDVIDRNMASLATGSPQRQNFSGTTNPNFPSGDYDVVKLGKTLDLRGNPRDTFATKVTPTDTQQVVRKDGSAPVPDFLKKGAADNFVRANLPGPGNAGYPGTPGTQVAQLPKTGVGRTPASIPSITAPAKSAIDTLNNVRKNIGKGSEYTNVFAPAGAAGFLPAGTDFQNTQYIKDLEAELAKTPNDPVIKAELDKMKARMAGIDPLMNKLQEALIKEGRVKELADDLKIMSDADFMKKYGKAKAAIRKDMKRVDEAQANYTPAEMSDIFSGKKTQQQVDAERAQKPLKEIDAPAMPAAPAAPAAPAKPAPQSNRQYAKTYNAATKQWTTNAPAANPMSQDPAQRAGKQIAANNAASSSDVDDSDPGAYDFDHWVDNGMGSATPVLKSGVIQNLFTKPLNQVPPGAKIIPKYDTYQQQGEYAYPVIMGGIDQAFKVRLDQVPKGAKIVQAPQQGGALFKNLPSTPTSQPAAPVNEQAAMPPDQAARLAPYLQKDADGSQYYNLPTTNPGETGAAMGQTNISPAALAQIKSPQGQQKIIQQLLAMTEPKNAVPQSTTAATDVSDQYAGGLNELSTNQLARYKTAAAKDAKAADQAGDFKRGDKRLSGMVQATKKQFDNDAKKVDESRAARRALMARIVNSR